MHTHIIFFRGINVGGKNILPMKDLKKSLEDGDLQDVRTYIQSGNVVLKSKEKKPGQVAKKVSSLVKKGFGIEPALLVLDAKKLSTAIKNNPFRKGEGKTIHFFFLETGPKKPDIEGLEKVKAASEEYKLADSVFYLYAPDGLARSKLAVKVEKCMGVTTTARNLNTVEKVFAMAGGK